MNELVAMILLTLVAEACFVIAVRGVLSGDIVDALLGIALFLLVSGVILLCLFGG